MRSDTVLVTSYVVQALLAATYGAAIFGFWRLYGQRYLRDWAYAWAVFAIYATAEGAAYWLALVAQESAERAVASMLSIASGLTFTVLLLRGALGLAERPRFSRRAMAWMVGGAVAIAIVFVELTAPESVHRTTRLLVRVGLVTGVMGGTAAWAGRLTFRMGRDQEWFGRRLLGIALVIFGTREVMGGLLLGLPGTGRVIAPTLTVFDALLVTLVGSAMAVSLLVTERARSRAAAAAAEAAQAALRESEARFRSIIEGASDVILTISPHGVVEFVAPSVTNLLGWDPEELVGRRAFDYIHPSDVELTQRSIERVIAGAGPVPALEIRLRMKTGAWLMVEALGTVGTTPQGTPMIVINARDLSERVELESRLLQAQKLESIGQLAGGVAHDFNNILTSILGHVSMARLGAPSDPQLHAELDDIQRSADRAAELTRQLLAFARRQVIEPVVLDINALVEGMRRLLSRIIGEHITLATELSPGLWPVKADPAQLEQAIVNLAINARDAMPGGGRLLLTTANVQVSESEATAHGLATRGEVVRIVVQDSGTGMDEATRARIFEPFFTTKGLNGGTGLGLAMVHGVVAQSGGGIAVFSSPGAGARFSILLPRYAGPVEPRTVRVEPRLITPDRAATILLVEDEPQVRSVASRVLRRGGYTVIEAANGIEGVARALGFTGRIDLIVSDLVMPSLSGPAMCAQIKASRPTVRILFMSGFSADTLPDGGALPQDASFIDKPFTVDDLLAKVRDELRLA
jgi:PAS domain S-box-containing protein